MKRFFGGKLLLAALVFATALFGFGCTEPPTAGGVTDRTDPNAPKTIESKELVGFYASFYLRGEWTPGKPDHEYTFAVRKNDAGELVASEATLHLSAPASAALLTALQDIIDANALALQNGVYRVTAGLPAEFRACTLQANYASGETLRFTVNGDPHNEWQKRVYLAFADLFSANGDDSLLPPTLHRRAESVRVCFTDGDVRTEYGVFSVSKIETPDDAQTLFLRSVSSSETYSEDYVEVPADLSDRVTEILARYDLRVFDYESVLYGLGRPAVPAEDEWTAKLQLHIYYEDGQCNINTDDAGEIEQLRPVVNDLFAYFDTLFDAE